MKAVMDKHRMLLSHCILCWIQVSTVSLTALACLLLTIILLIVQSVYMAIEHWQCVQHTFLNACVCIQVNQHHIFYDLTAKVQTRFALALISLSAGEPCTGYKSAHAQNASLFQRPLPNRTPFSHY